jgi:hypothetical protein
MRGIAMYHGVIGVEATEGHRLVIRFDNDERRVFDVTPLLSTGRFRELISPQAFRKVRVAFDTVEWENGLDLDPEYLYERSEPLHGEHTTTADTAGLGAAEP